VLAGALAHRKPRQKSSGKKVLDEANTARPDAAPTGSRELIYGLAAALMQPFLRFCANEANRGKASKNNVAR
jgi:hypothetical protein